MKTIPKVQSVVLSAILLATFFPAARPVFSTSGNSSYEQPSKDGSMTAKEGNEVHIVVDVPKESYAGNAITITMKLQNDSDEKIRCTRTTMYYDFSIKIKDSAGNIVPKTRYGQMVMKDDNRRPILTRVLVWLSFGESDERSYNIARVFDLTLRDKYTVSVSRKCWAVLQEMPAKEREVSVSTEAVLDVQ
jgi:hypothetical protein